MGLFDNAATRLTIKRNEKNEKRVYTTNYNIMVANVLQPLVFI